MPEERIKAHVRRRFSAAVPVYERWAVVQRQAARYLLALLPEKPFDRVLDIGCGTGFLIEGLLESGWAGTVTGIDFAPDMVESCRRRWPEHHFVCADAEVFEPFQSFDLILSNFTFQWLEDVPAAVEKYYSFLDEKGVLALAVPVSGSLRELSSSALAANGKPLHLLDFPAQKALETAFRSLEGCRFAGQMREVTAWFDTPLECIRSLKGIGASYGGRGVYTVAEMRRLLEEYEKTHGIPPAGSRPALVVQRTLHLRLRPRYDPAPIGRPTVPVAGRRAASGRPFLRSPGRPPPQRQASTTPPESSPAAGILVASNRSAASPHAAGPRPRRSFLLASVVLHFVCRRTHRQSIPPL